MNNGINIHTGINMSLSEQYNTCVNTLLFKVTLLIQLTAFIRALLMT